MQCDDLRERREQGRQGRMVGPPRGVEDSGGEDDKSPAALPSHMVIDANTNLMATCPSEHTSVPTDPAGLSGLMPPLLSGPSAPPCLEGTPLAHAAPSTSPGLLHGLQLSAAVSPPQGSLLEPL